MRIPKRLLLILIIALLVGLGYFLGQPYLQVDSHPPVEKEQKYITAESSSKKSISTLGLDDQKAPNVELSALNGQTKTLKDYKGKPLLLVTWATWCKECHKELQSLQKSSSNDKAPFSIVLINMTSEEGSLSDVKQYVSKQHLTLPILLDQKGEFEKVYHVQVIPTSILIDSYGNVLHTFYGPVSQPTIMNWLPSV